MIVSSIPEKEVFPIQGKPSRNRQPRKPARCVSPAEWAWLARTNRQLAHDEYMQARREFWLAARPSMKR